MPFQLISYRRRHCVFQVSLLDATGLLIAVGPTDVIRVKIGRSGDVPLLDLSSNAATANGSSVTLTNPATVTLRGDDAADNIHPGLWDIEAGMYDESEDAMLHVDKGPLALFDTQLGLVDAELPP